MSLDKYWGTYSGIGNAALQESWNELKQAEINNQRRAQQYQQKLEDEEFNLLLDHYEHEKALKKRALNYSKQLEGELMSLAQKYQLLVEQNNNMAISLRQTQSDLVKSKATNQELLNQNLTKDRENLVLKGEVEKIKVQHSRSVEHNEQTTKKISQSYELSKRIQDNTEQTFTLLQAKLSTEKMEALMSTKLAYTQNLVLKRILAKQISLGVFDPSDYKETEALVIKAEDEKDIKRQGVTFAESYDWIMTHNPSKIETILGFKP